MKSVGPCALVLILLGVGAVRGQYSMPPSSYVPAADAAAQAAPPAGPAPMPHHLSSWITYACPECCGPLGGAPIRTEMYFRIGPSFPIEGKFFDETLTTGWDLGAGGRVLFFNRARDAAWVGAVGVTNISNHAEDPGVTTPITVAVPGPATGLFGTPGPDVLVAVDASLSNLNRTFVDFGIGREWYLMGTADCEGRRWRAGVDAGGRWGTAKAEFNQIRSRTEAITGTYFNVHSDVEMSWGCCLLLAGLRLEYDYTWLNGIIQQKGTTLQDLNLLFNFGVCF